VAQIQAGWNDRLEELAQAVYKASTPSEFYDAERAVAADARQRSDELVAAILKFRATEPATVQPAKEAAQAKAKAADVVVKSHGERTTRVRLLGGTEIRFETLALLPVAKKRPGRKRGVGRRGKGGAGVYPVLDMLGINGKATPALLAEVAREMTESTSYEVALASLRERGVDISKQVAMRLTYVMAARALELRDARIEEATRYDLPETGELAGKRVFVSIDGGRTRIRHTPKAGRRNAKTRHRRYKAPWKEPRVMCVYVLDDKGDKDRRFKTFLDGTMGDADETLALMIGHLRLLGAHLAEHVTLAADGAEWIWERADRLREGIGVARDLFAEVVDWYHAVEHLHDVANIPKNWGDGEREKWLKRAKKHLYAGKVELVLQDIQDLRVGRRGKEVGKGARYFRNNAERMRYADFRAAGIPCGSGGVESAVRRVVNLRMKGNSKYWLPEHAEGMLHLRAYLKADRWDELVRATINHPVWPPRA